ncbi:MAG: hypothetical protein AB7K24_23055 [Gemmataceae bacterium]
MSEGSRFFEEKADGVTLDQINDGQARLVTTDPEVARTYGMQDEKDFWDATS